MRRVVALTMLGVLLGGCDEFAALREHPKQLTVSALTPADAGIAEKVLQSRFRQHLPHLVSSISSRRDGPRVTFVFGRGSPDDKVLGYLVSTRGRFVTLSSEGQVWVTGKDVVEVLVSTGSDSDNALLIAFTDAAAKRLADLSSQKQGQILTVLLDGNALATLRVAGTVSQRVTVPVRMDPRELLLIATVVSSGELPVGVTVTGNAP